MGHSPTVSGKIKDSKIEIQTTDFTKTFEEEYTYSDDPETPCEKLIEYAGFGSIENLEGSNIYVTPKEKIQHRSKRFAIERLPDSWNVIDKTEDNEIITAKRPTNGNFYQSKLLSKIVPKGINTVLLTLSAMAIINMLMLGIYTPSSGIPLYAAIFLIFSPIIPAVVLTVPSRGYFVE